jgi:protein gp37
MGDKSAIQWTNATWNPVTGCTKVSQGCKNCYAETIAERLWATQYHPNADGSPRRFTDVRLHADRIEQPLRWKKPRRIFVNSMSDLFHESIPPAFIAECFAVMAQATQHTFQVLTKRPERMQELLTNSDWMSRVDAAMQVKAGERGWCVDEVEAWPLPNVWLGVSVEDGANADKRIPLLWQTPARVRFLSCEPLLGPLHLSMYLHQLDWVIVGGESGQGARPFHLAWARDIVRECRDYETACFVKQLGANAWTEREHLHLRDNHGGDPDEWPADLRVREFPEGVKA